MRKTLTIAIALSLTLAFWVLAAGAAAAAATSVFSGAAADVSPTAAAGATPDSVADALSVALKPRMPRKVWIGGDSMAYQIRPTLESKLRVGGVGSVPWLCKSSSGIVRTDFMNWPNAARAQMKKYQPQVAVFMIGTNDHQDITAKGRIYRFGSSGWKSIYRTRVAAITKAMLSSGAERVYWIGMPIMASSSFGKAMRVLNAIYKSETRKRSQVTYIDAWRLFSDAGGGYVSTWRSSDGIHFSMSGVERLAGAVLTRIRKDF